MFYPGESVLEEDLSLLIGLSVALLVFLSVTLLSIKLIRRKGRSQSIYNMASLGRSSLSQRFSKQGETSELQRLQTIYILIIHIFYRSLVMNYFPEINLFLYIQRRSLQVLSGRGGGYPRIYFQNKNICKVSLGQMNVPLTYFPRESSSI